jgi:hypothetical protein
MKPDDLNLKPQYRMPGVFGALPAPRNIPKDKQLVISAARWMAGRCSPSA